MLSGHKKPLLGILIDAVDYETAVDCIMGSVHEGRGLAVSALAVHGVMTGVLDAEHKYRLNHFDLLVPDGHPVRWALNLLHRARLQDRVYGPNLTLAVCGRAAKEGVAAYFYGSTPEILSALRINLESRFPELRIAGMEPSRFRRLSPDERNELVVRVRRSGASILFVGLGCPRQEVWAYENRDLLSMPILAVGAAFPFLAGKAPQAPKWFQDNGLEWLFRLWTEPRRLWRRYVFLNPAYVFLVTLQATGLAHFTVEGKPPSTELLCG
jgi:exopolysaccharide biosynthesis WecB/TagA/CpsF family protein